ncbi:hypothetical protein KY084_14980 [Stakelama sp. CBK3Z-3]|uniref:Uncharacterized protein n=1 Tax=Stakelama flava TaxID=2860338 RepID=A0ABS6XQK2_9SPHN|nr:hypothetical protein [Stakelama flava]MBW4332164.1 hypothetical protein [Stakelama flava]
MSQNRSSLLALIDNAERSGKADSALPFYATPASEIAAFASQHALDISFVYLVMTFATGDTAVWRRMIEALPEDADTRLVTVRWISWLWDDPEIGFRARIQDSVMRANGDAICALHHRAIRGEPVARSAWRQARAKLLPSGDSDAVEAAAAEGIAAAAWDLDRSPGVATDMIYPWKAILFAEIGRDLEWDTSKQKAADERRNHMVAAARAHAEAAVEKARKLGELSSEQLENVATSPLYQNAYNQGANDFLTQFPSELDRYGDRTRVAVADLYRQGREGLLQQIESLSAAPVSTAT